jgi:hypothetical protein
MGGITMTEEIPKINREGKYTDTFVRKTVYIEEKLLEIIQELASNRKGEQTRIIDAALRSYLSNPDNIAKHSSVEDWWKKPFWKGITIHPTDE